MAEIKTFIERRMHSTLRNHLKKREITVITGMRRVGKTTLLTKLLEETGSSNKVYFDLEKISNREVFEEKNYDNVVLYLEREHQLNFRERVYIALDEIQLCPQLPSVLKYLYDHYDIKFIVTGSSSFYIKNLFTESLAGRKTIFEIFPLDFNEFLDFKGVAHASGQDFLDIRITGVVYERLKQYYEEFTLFGGFPEVVMAETVEDKRRKLLDIINSYISIDIASVHDFADNRETYVLMKMLAIRTGSRLEYSKLSKLTGIPRKDVHDYIDFFEETYLIHRVPVYTHNIDREIVKAKKLYWSDTGLANILADIDGGTQFENTVFNQLKQFGGVSYYALKNGKELDFIYDLGYAGKYIAIEAKETPTPEDLRDMKKIATVAGIDSCLLVGRRMSPNFSDYLWGGDIR